MSKIKFLITLGSAIRNGAVKTIKQAVAFAEQQFGKIDKSFVDDIVNVFKKEGKIKKKGEVVPIKKEEGIVAADAAKEVLEKRTKDIAKSDVEEVVDLETTAKKLKEAADELKKVADEPKPFMEIAEGPKKGQKITIDDFFNMVGSARDPRRGIVRTAAREILNKNKVKIGSEDPINVLRQMYGEKGLEALDAVSNSLLDAQSYGEINTILKNNKLFDLVPKKTYGYDQSVVAAEKIRKAKEQEAKQKKILDEFDIDPDREPNAYGGIAGQLHLNRTGYKIGGGIKAFKLAKEIRQSKGYKDFIEALFIKASNMIRQGKGIFKNLDESQRIKQHDNLTKEVTNFQKTGELREGVDQYFGINAEKAFKEARAKVQKQSTADEITKGIADVMQDTSEAGLARSIEVDNLKLEFPGITDDMINNILADTNPQRIAEVKATMKEALKMLEKGKGSDEIINIFKKTPRTKHASGGLAGMLGE